MFKNILKKQKDTGLVSNDIKIYNPIKGEIIPIGKVPDQVFAEKICTERLNPDTDVVIELGGEDDFLANRIGGIIDSFHV